MLCRRPWPFERCRMADPDGRQRKYLAPNRLRSVVGRVSFSGARPAFSSGEGARGSLARSSSCEKTDIHNSLTSPLDGHPSEQRSFHRLRSDSANPQAGGRGPPLGLTFPFRRSLCARQALWRAAEHSRSTKIIQTPLLYARERPIWVRSRADGVSLPQWLRYNG